MSFDRISVIGLGYIGLPTAAMFASKEKSVIGVDVSQHAVDTINAGKIHIVEPELDTMVKKAVDGGFLKATTTAEPADVFLIAVPTPFLPAKNESSIPEPDLSYIQSAAKAVARVLITGNLVILESTSPVGTTEQMAEWLAEERPDLTFPHTHGEGSDIRIAYCPERVLPGHVIRELVENDRVIGGITNKCADAAVQVYKTFVQGDCVVTNARTAEMAKLTENASRDVGIAFANELSIICDKLDINVWELIKLANRHPRVNILQPGPGVGGHCIAVDPWFVVSSSPQVAKLIRAARDVNDSKPGWVLEKIKAMVADHLSLNPAITACKIKIACFGIAFKPNIDDCRESPALSIVEKLSDWHSGEVMVVEPNIDSLPLSLENCSLVSSEVAVKDADIIVMLVDHREFSELVFDCASIVDTKGIIKR